MESNIHVTSRLMKSVNKELQNDFAPLNSILIISIT